MRRPISIYDYEDYRLFMREWVRSVPEKPRGQLARLSEAGKIHKTSLSQVLKGSKDLTFEQAHRISGYLGLSQAETEFWHLLVSHERAGTTELRRSIHRQIEARRAERSRLVNRVSRTRVLGSEERAIYYSNWIYAAVRNLTAIPGFGRLPELARRLRIPDRHLSPIIEFLLRTGLCIEPDFDVGHAALGIWAVGNQGVMTIRPKKA